MRSVLRVCVLLLLLPLGGCGAWHYTVNAPLERYSESHGYRLANLEDDGNSDSLLVLAAFSGGGMRAAALSYGVLERLAAERITWEGRSKRLLDEIDIINAVSGGSITAAYYALHRDRIFEDFERRIVLPNLQDQLASRIISLTAIPRLLSPRYGRADMLQEFLDESLFEGRTFAELTSSRRRPFVVISATDMALGARLEFTQDYFNLICSDLDRFPVARAVAASAAVPLLLSPVTLWNYAGKCDAPTAFLEAPAAEGEIAPRQQQRRRELASYLDAQQRPFLHLLDGGLSDNIGLGAFMEAAEIHGSVDAAIEALGFRGVRKLVFIIVNAETESDRGPDLSADVPGILQVGRALGDIPINRYSYETQLRLTQSLQRWHRSQQVPPESRVDLYIINVGLQALEDPEERLTLMSLPTALQLPAESVARIRAAAARLMENSPDFRRLLSDLR
ncbi:MAG: patatin-like phospholipase family protein [Burkholderiales bacterium]|jgi:NTE family protein|nr:patatin-like phospholipase family protein [Burkholderiales bacterium]